MSSRWRFVAMSISCVAAIACNQRGSKTQNSGSGSGSGSGSNVAAAAIDAGAPALDASLSDGTLQLVGIDVLTQPQLFQQRAAGAGPKPMEPLVAAAKDAVRAVDAAKPGVLGDSVRVWVAVRPGKQLRAWLATPGKTGADSDAARAEVTGKMTLAAVPDVSGPVAFMITFDRSGHRPFGHDIPIPPELERTRRGSGDAPTPEELIDRAWTP